MADETDMRHEAKRAFYEHLGVYVVVIAGLFAINMLSSPGTLWFLYVAVGWGIAVGIHAVSLYFGEEPMQKVEEGDEEQDKETRRAA